ncbi:MAG: translational GTPase TypA [SAR202 cluster bacterium]|nr:translational GTPase TypA [SAR202 cluster bacterium]
MINEQSNDGIRNIAIIAHVDHGKTTLVDALLKQGQVFRAHQEVGALIMDSNPLEKERGITILAKNTAVSYNGTKINIIDTPGHADFSGEVERIMNMADGCLLLVDAVDGPMPQTRFVLKQALEHDLAPLVVINKIDRPEARVLEVIELVQDLFLELATKAEQLDFPILYSSARDGYAVSDMDAPREDMQPLFEAMIDSVPAPIADADAPFQMLVAALDYDNYLGQIAIGRVFRGAARWRNPVALLRNGNQPVAHSLEKIFVFRGLERLEVTEADAGDIVAVTGVDGVSIGDTLTDQEHPEPLPSIVIEEPTVKMTFGVNTSPFMGREATYSTSRTLHERLMRELRTNVSLRVETTDSPDEFMVSGRGELHLSILIETMRREGHDFQVSKPEPATKTIDGKIHEPFEQLTIDVREEFIGPLTEDLAGRLAELINMTNDGVGNVRLEYNIPTRGLIGFRSGFLRDTRGTGVTNSLFTEFRPMSGHVKTTSNGVLVASEPGNAITYGLLNAQGRGETFVEPGTPVYEGMIVGVHPNDQDIIINVCKEKKLTNMRAASADIVKRLSPAIKLSLEDALDFIADDELVEVTPQNYRLRKKVLSGTDRHRQRRNVSKGRA